MIWKGQEIKTFADLLSGIKQCETKEEAQEFMRLYRKETPHADENVGYLSGYFTPEEMARIQDWFGVTHPMFGKVQPLPKEAFEVGKSVKQEEIGM